MNQKEQPQLSNDSAEKVIILFRSIHKIFKDQVFEKSKQYGLTVPQLGVVFVLNKYPFITLNEVSERMGLSKSTVSGIVDRLVARCIVIREIPEDNRRIVRLSLSPDFLKNNDLIDLKNKYLSDIIKDADPEDIEKIVTGLEKLYSLMNKG